MSYVFQTTGQNTDGGWWRVIWGGDYIVGCRAGDSLGGGTLTMTFADTDEEALAMPSAASFSAPIASQIVTLAQGTLVQFAIGTATNPEVNVFLRHTTIAGTTLEPA